MISLTSAPRVFTHAVNHFLCKHLDWFGMLLLHWCNIFNKYAILSLCSLLFLALIRRILIYWKFLTTVPARFRSIRSKARSFHTLQVLYWNLLLEYSWNFSTKPPLSPVTSVKLLLCFKRCFAIGYLYRSWQGPEAQWEPKQHVCSWLRNQLQRVG